MYRPILIYIIVAFPFQLLSQEKMVVQHSYAGSTYYEGFSKEVKSVGNLPSQIASQLEGLLNKFFGDLKNKITYENGQKVNLKKYYSNKQDAFNKEWMVPKYDLNFILRDSAMGLAKYNVNIRLDEYGQLIEINWPKRGYNARSYFLHRDKILEFALGHAEKKGFKVAGYKVSCRYNKKFDELCWVFMFAIGSNYYSAIEVPWGGRLRILTEHEVRISEVN